MLQRYRLDGRAIEHLAEMFDPFLEFSFGSCHEVTIAVKKCGGRRLRLFRREVYDTEKVEISNGSCGFHTVCSFMPISLSVALR